MVRPNHFGYNFQTAGSNAFQNNEIREYPNATLQARLEFDKLVDRMKDLGIEVKVFEENDPNTPDAVFPNNWISFHEDGKVVLYPMMAKNRRLERRKDIIYDLEKKYQVTEVLDLSVYEAENKFLEGTGSIVFDYVNKIAYACRSPRTDEELLNICCHELGYRPVLFEARDREGKQIYHTNVLMALTDDLCIICLESISETDRELVKESLYGTGREIVDISFEQMEKFAGNMIQLSNRRGRKFLVMSAAAYKSLRASQLMMIETYMEPLFSDLETIETLGGGSARCMIAGIYLPSKKLAEV